MTESSKKEMSDHYITHYHEVTNRAKYICGECGLETYGYFPYFQAHLTSHKVFLDSEEQYCYYDSKLRILQKNSADKRLIWDSFMI